MTTRLVRCRQGHVFDLNHTDACPICGEIVATPENLLDGKIIPPAPDPRSRNDILKHLTTYPLNVGTGLGLIVLACSVWYLASPRPSPFQDACLNPAATTDDKKACPAAPVPVAGAKSQAASKQAAAPAEQPIQAAASPTANVAQAPASEAPPSQAAQRDTLPPTSRENPPSPPTPQTAAPQAPQPRETSPSEPQPPSNESPPTATPAPDDADLDPLIGMRLFADRSPAKQPTHHVVLEQAAADFAIGMRRANGVAAALVCEDPTNDRFGSGAITVWMDAKGQSSDVVDEHPAPTVKVDGVKIALDLALRIDGKEFNLKKLRVLTVKNGHRLVGDVEPTDTLFAAMTTANRVEIVGDGSVLMVEIGGRFDELKKIVEGCERIAGVNAETPEPDTAPSATPIGSPQSSTSAPDPIIAALEDKYHFTPLARELLATSEGAYAYDRKDYQAAKAWLSSNAVNDNPAANFYRAQMAQTGNGAPQDYAAALHFFAESANAGFYWAQLRLGKIYSSGDFPGVSANPQKAKPWLIMAAKEDRGEANRMLSEMGVPKAEIKPTRTDLELALGRSYQEAFDIANALIAQGSGSAYFWAGSFMHDGQGTVKNPAAGRELIRKGARAYDAPSIVTVAQWSFDGEATPQNVTEAVTLAYIARENAVFGDDASMIDKRTSAFLDKISNEQYEDVRLMLKGIRDIPARPASR